MVLLVGLQPIIANARNKAELDAFIFAAMTCVVECVVFFPIMLAERRKIRKTMINPELQNIGLAKLHGWKKNAKLLVYIGINFGIAQILFFLGYQYAGSINGALAQKTTVIFSLVFAYFINKERVTKLQVFFSCVLLFGLALAITEGSFNLLEFNVGVLIMMITTTLWMLAHAITKPVLDRHESTPIQLVFIRNGLSAIILLVAYITFAPITNLSYLLDWENFGFYMAMGIVYGFDLFCWYKVLYYLGTSKASIVASPTPIATAFFALFLGDFFTIYHAIGMGIIILSIFFIIQEKKVSSKEIQPNE